ncbi:MAG: T9SS type A sorting domain-containing protein, partial [Bacteroidota bacterium]
NNVFSGVKGVVGSYDPNDKQVAPTGEGTDGLIRESETKLTYTVRFQNTGNYPATFVIIRDTIDENILLRSIKPVGASHDYTMTMDEANRSVEITFANIQLPDSASDPEGSQGYIIFNAQLEPGLAVGTEIENTAFIYFDFNAPIVTNTVKNTIFRPVSVDFELDTEIQLYPNPNTGFFTLKSKTDLMERVVVYDVMGKEVQRLQTNAKEAMVDLTQVAGGMYWVEIQTANNRFLHKVMIEK